MRVISTVTLVVCFACTACSGDGATRVSKDHLPGPDSGGAAASGGTSATGGGTGSTGGSGGTRANGGTGGASGIAVDGGIGTDAGVDAAGAAASGGAGAGSDGGPGNPVDAGAPVRFTNLQPESALARDGDVIEYTLTVDKPAPSGGAVVTVEVLPSGGSMSLAAPTTIMVAAGETTATFSVTVSGVGAVAIRLSAGNTRHAWIASPVSVDRLVLSEVYYNPPGIDDGKEAVELYNGGSTAIDLSSYVLLAAGQAYAPIAGLSGEIAPGQCLAVTGLSGMPNTTTGQPANALALFDGSAIVDAVIYGGPNVANLPDETGTPGTVDSPSGAFTGLSLHRVGPNAWWTAPPSIGDCSLIAVPARDGGVVGGHDAGYDAGADGGHDAGGDGAP